MSRLVALYPRPWRARYEEELRWLLAERPMSLRTRADLVLGAIDARLFPQLEGDPMTSDSNRAEQLRRRLGLLTIAGVVPWLAAFVVASMGPIVFDGRGPYRDGSLGLPLIVIAIVLLAAGIVAHLLRIRRGGAASRIAAVAAIGALVVWALMPWAMHIGFAGVIALALFAWLEWRAGRWPTWAAMAMTALAIGLSVLGVLALSTTVDRLNPSAASLAAIGLASALWLITGATLLADSAARVPRDPTAPRLPA
jgi:amino acid transporter